MTLRHPVVGKALPTWLFELGIDRRKLHYNTMQYAATRCNTLQYNILQYTATHCTMYLGICIITGELLSLFLLRGSGSGIQVEDFAIMN